MYGGTPSERLRRFAWTPSLNYVVTSSTYAFSQRASACVSEFGGGFVPAEVRSAAQQADLVTALSSLRTTQTHFYLGASYTSGAYRWDSDGAALSDTYSTFADGQGSGGTGQPAICVGKPWSGYPKWHDCNVASEYHQVCMPTTAGGGEAGLVVNPNECDRDYS